MNESTHLSPQAAAAIPPVKGDTGSLLEDLRALLPPQRLLTSHEDLFVYECDAQTLDRAVPLAVAFPETTEEVVAIVKACVQRDVPFLARGAGTGLSGGAVAVGSVVLSTARMNRILETDLPNRQAWVQPGVVNIHLTRAVSPHGLHFAPDPSSQPTCTIGGNLAENASGPHTLKYGVSGNHILAVETVLPDGSVETFGAPAADAPELDFRGILIGSEGTLGIATKILVRLTPLPEGIKTAMAIFNTAEDACRGVTEILSRGVIPAALEMIDRITLQAVEDFIHAGFPRDAAAVLLIEVDGLVDELEEQAETVVEACRHVGAREVRLAADEAERMQLWKGRKQAFGAFGRIAPNIYTHDGVIPRTKLPEVLTKIYQIGERLNLRISNVFHAGDGNLHPVILFDEREPGVIDRVRTAGGEILKVVASVNGALSGEHGIGLEKLEYMGDFLTEEDLNEMRRLRTLFDPHERCNPGKAVPMPREGA